jgi:hypothetical protein
VGGERIGEAVRCFPSPLPALASTQKDVVATITALKTGTILIRPSHRAGRMDYPI